jgi:hypothetical protein
VWWCVSGRNRLANCSVLLLAWVQLQRESERVYCMVPVQPQKCTVFLCCGCRYSFWEADFCVVFVGAASATRGCSVDIYSLRDTQLFCLHICGREQAGVLWAYLQPQKQVDILFTFLQPQRRAVVLLAYLRPQKQAVVLYTNLEAQIHAVSLSRRKHFHLELSKRKDYDKITQVAVKRLRSCWPLQLEIWMLNLRHVSWIVFRLLSAASVVPTSHQNLHQVWVGNLEYTERWNNLIGMFLISNFRRVLNAVCFFSGRFTGACSLDANVSEHTVPPS